MTTNTRTALAAGAAIFLLSACGQDNGNPGAAGDEPETAAASAPANLDWMPAAIILPQRHTVVQNTPIGTRTNLLQINVKDDPKAELPKWQVALSAAGYETNDAMLADGRLLFQGSGIESGQIAVMPAEDGGFMIQVDVSRD